VTFPPINNFRAPVALICFLLTAVIGLALDQWSKVQAFQRLCSGVELVGDRFYPIAPQQRTLIPGLIDLTAVTNQGAVFGVGQGKRTLFVVVSGAAILFIFYLFANSGRQRIYQILLGMLLAGVLGNLYDRLKYSYVRDMIHGLPYWPRLFPYIFNVADTLLCTGVGLMIVYSLFTDPAKPEPEPEPDAGLPSDGVRVSSPISPTSPSTAAKAKAKASRAV
jgi:signal peptidase II